MAFVALRIATEKMKKSVIKAQNSVKNLGNYLVFYGFWNNYNMFAIIKFVLIKIEKNPDCLFFVYLIHAMYAFNYSIRAFEIKIIFQVTQVKKSSN